MKLFAALLGLFIAAGPLAAVPAGSPIHVAIIGLVHDHAYGFIPLTRHRTDAQLTGIVEPDPVLCAAFAKRFHLEKDLFYPTLDALSARTNVDAVAVFTSTYDHPKVVEMCAPLHIDVMMEKPLAVNMAAARAIAKAAKKGGIQVIVNYETTWYPSMYEAHRLVDGEHAIGDIRKMVAHDGHRGPKEIGCSATFLKWLTDPKLDGGGALPDFGCYGAGLMTWLMDGQPPQTVMAVTQHMKPDIYPKVEDEATIVLTYPQAQGIIQASWNWPLSRKDMEIYGTEGCVLAPKRDSLQTFNLAGQEKSMELSKPPDSEPRDQLAYLARVVHGEITPSGPSSLENNLIVTEILDAARKSARTGRRINLPSRAP